MVEVSFHLGGYGPVSFRFDEVTHPMFVRLPSGYYLRFEDAAADSRLLAALQRRIRRRLDDRLTQDGVAASLDRSTQELAAYAWFLSRLGRALEKRSAVREAERILGFSPPLAPTPVLRNGRELLGALAECGQRGIRHEDGFGLVRLSIAEARTVLQLEDWSGLA